MTRGVTTLETMVRDLRLETRRSSNTNFGQDEYEALKRLLYRTQFFLYWDFAWPFLKVRRDITLQATDRYYDFPTDMDFERIIRVRANGNGAWTPIIRGIGMEQYDIFDSDDAETSFPVERWDIIDAGSGDQLEVWPMPSQDDEILRFEGFKKLADFSADDDVCTLDDTLIVLFAAAELLTGEDPELAKVKLQAANKLYLRMRGGAERREGGFFVMGAGSPPADPHNRPSVIAVHDGA